MTMTHSKRCISIGECMLELSSVSSSPTDNQWNMGFAGDTLNTAWYIRALLDSQQWIVSYYTRLGEDVYSCQAKQFLEQNAIDCSLISHDPTRNIGLYLIELEDGERSFTYWRENSAARCLADNLAALEKAVDSAEVIFFSGITMAIINPAARAALISVISKATESGKMTVFDPNIRIKLWESTSEAKKNIMSAASACSVVLPSFDDESFLFEDATPKETLHRYLDLGINEIVVKNGSAPILAANHGQHWDIPITPSNNIIDTTGAGDAFNGTYLSARLMGSDTKTAVQQAQKLASMVIGHHGALVKMSTISETINLN